MGMVFALADLMYTDHGVMQEMLDFFTIQLVLFLSPFHMMDIVL